MGTALSEPATAPPWQVHTGLLAVQAIFAGFHVVGKAVLEELHPLALADLRVLLATPLLLLLAWRHDRVLPAPRDLPYLALLGLLGVFANQLLFIIGLSHTTAINAAILMPSIPAFAVAVGAVSGVDRVGPRRLAGILLSVAGALLLLRPARFSLADDTVRGNLLITANCLSYASFLVLQRPILRRLPWRTVIAWAFLFGGLGVVAVGWRPLAALPVASVSAGVWIGVAYIVLLPTALGHALNTWAVRQSSPSLVATYTTLQPLISALLAVAFLGESFGRVELAGFLLIAGGLAVVARRSRSPEGRG